MVLEELLELPNKLRIKWLIKKGLHLGANCYIVRSAIIDGSFPWLISIGDNCTITCNVVILAHDASTKRQLGCSKIGAVTIGNNCFIGAGTIILPNVHVGNNVIIGAGSVVSRDIPDNSVAIGNPARVVRSTRDFMDFHLQAIRTGPSFPKEGWTERHGLTEERKRIIKDSIKGKVGYAD
ncbi:MAG: DapH/DapD/GlmU-related protein [Candidatus Bathyarchaeia archaeon]|jgi:maltose O-acetyltransferase